MGKSQNKVRYMTPSEAATLLMISPVTLRHWALAGKLAFVTTPGGHRRFAEDEVKRFASQYTQVNGALVTRINSASGGDGAHRILIVDDDVQLSGFLVELLQGLPDPVRTEVANDGFEAGQKLQTFRPHTVLLDLMMPGIKGFDVCRKIKENPETCDTRVVVMTGYHTLENMMQAMEAGAEACLAKPLDKIQLFKVIVLGGINTVKNN
ncbi:MAG TPA: response regulator [Gammaproteobacteria bacterium]|nr:response regulator [Gammaproteobacteria bacterium]